MGMLTLFFVLTLLLTQPLSNQAAAVLILPIAMQSAVQLGLNPRSFAVMIALGASCSFITPLEPACLIVYGPGHYRFLDFVKVGSILTITGLSRSDHPGSMAMAFESVKSGCTYEFTAVFTYSCRLSAHCES